MSLHSFRIFNIITAACIFCNINFLGREIDVISIIEVTGIPISVFRTNQIPVITLVSEYLFIALSSSGIVMGFLLNNKSVVLDADTNQGIRSFFETESALFTAP